MGSSPSCDRIDLRYRSISLYMKETTSTQYKFFPLIFIEIYIIIMKQANEYIHQYSTGTGKYINVHTFFYFFLLLYNSSSRAPLTEKNFLSISRVLTNKAERRIPEERPNFGLV